MDTILITVPTIWDADKNTKQNGNAIAIEAVREQQELRNYLDAGFIVKATTSFVFNGVSYIHYVLEREAEKTSVECTEVKLQRAKYLLQTLISNAPNNYAGNVEKAQVKLAKWLQTVADADAFCKEN